LFVGLVLVLTTVATGQSAGARSAGAADPPAPKVPRSFTWSGRYIVPDLGVEVPFTWHGNAGNMQMIAGDDDSPIHFTNLIYDGTLYTLTYEWPGIERRPCSPIGPFTLRDLNKGLETSRFVGAETLDDAKPRRVNHFRAGVVWEPPPDVIPPIPGVPIRIPLMSGDIYVDRKDPSKFWKVLQFGIQNLYDAELDEWIVINKSSDRAGKVELPAECATAPGAPTSAPPTSAP
jgi:hypothetical protein